MTTIDKAVAVLSGLPAIVGKWPYIDVIRIWLERPLKLPAISTLEKLCGGDLHVHDEQQPFHPKYRQRLRLRQPTNRALTYLLNKVGGAHKINYATQPYPGSNIYGGTKGFVHVLSRNLRTDLAGTGIRVTDIQPGSVETEFARVRFDGDEARAKAVYQGFRPLTPEDIAEVVEFVIGTPDHVNISSIEVMPTDQAAAGFIIGGPTG